jgi:hypothetical protein
VSAPVITESVIRRIRSRDENNFTDRVLAIMRNAFGGHAVKKTGNLCSATQISKVMQGRNKAPEGGARG